jgi:deoxyribodipyrimidine photo-lyase
MKAKIIIWFRNDLRLHDHEPLTRALAKTQDVLPVYCFDPRQFKQTSLGFTKTGYFRLKFLIESVADLRRSLQERGSNLVVRIGKPEDIIPELAETFEATAVFASKEVASEEISVENLLEQKLWKRKTALELFYTHTLFHPEDIPYPVHNLPDIFTDFRKEVERSTTIRKSFSTPEALMPFSGIDTGVIPEPADFSIEPVVSQSEKAVLMFKGGETEGLKRLHNYFWKQNLLKNYKETRNGLLGADYSSKFSAWLTLGCLSPRKIYEEIKKYEYERVKNESTYWLVFELIWRDYFKFVAKKYKNQIFQKGGIRGGNRINLKDDEYLFGKWCNGETGIPFIDANMRELLLTGFMSNRGRQNVASFLVKDLEVNWIWGAMWFESQLIDYDVCSNWGNWLYVAGVGNDPREDRYFNIITQAQRYDTNAAYTKYWLPELELVPSKKIHHLNELSLEEQKNYELIVGVDYPQPLVKLNKGLRV